MNFKIEPFQAKHRSAVISLIEHIQLGEFNIPIDDSQRKGLNTIRRHFKSGIATIG